MGRSQKYFVSTRSLLAISSQKDRRNKEGSQRWAHWDGDVVCTAKGLRWQSGDHPTSPCLSPLRLLCIGLASLRLETTDPRLCCSEGTGIFWSTGWAPDRRPPFPALQRPHPPPLRDPTSLPSLYAQGRGRSVDREVPRSSTRAGSCSRGEGPTVVGSGDSGFASP
ncbi:unnamed protein product [Eretmochelys imbricata]